MSIINEAIKKARKQSAIGDINAGEGSTRGRISITPSFRPSEIRWTMIAVVSLVITVSLLGSLILYKHLNRPDIVVPPPLPGSTAITPSPEAAVQPRAVPPAAKRNTTWELNGIVYEPQDKWAIINDRIVREGDFVGDGKLAVIEKDFVKIERPDGEKVILNLR